MKYNEPVKATCPIIDSIIRLAEGSDEEVRIISLCEEVRDANEKLRNWGNDCDDARIELESKIEKKESDIFYLKDRISELESENDKLATQLLEIKNA